MSVSRRIERPYWHTVDTIADKVKNKYLLRKIQADRL